MENLANIYSELYSYLNILGNDFISKIPVNIYKQICESKNSEYNPIYNDIDDFEDVNKMSTKTRLLVFYLHFKYWCDSEEEKKQLKGILKENEEKYQNKLREQFNPDNIFKNKEKATTQENEKINQNVAMVEYKESFFKRIINNIKKFIRKK